MKRCLGTARCFLRLPYLVLTNPFLFFFFNQYYVVIGTNTDSPKQVSLAIVLLEKATEKKTTLTTETLVKSSSSRFTEGYIHDQAEKVSEGSLKKEKEEKKPEGARKPPKPQISSVFLTSRNQGINVTTLFKSDYLCFSG